MIKHISFSPFHQLLVLALLGAGLLLGGVQPLWQKNERLKAGLETTEDELIGLRKLAGEIQFLEARLGDVSNEKVQSSLLKQVEDISRKTGVFDDIRKITPVQVEERQQAMALSFEKISFERMLPLFEKIENQSRLTIKQMELMRRTDPSGHVDIRLTVLEVL